MSRETAEESRVPQWRYSIRANNGQRLLMRIALIFDQQALTPVCLHWNVKGSRVQIEWVVTCEPALAQRIHAKLYALHDVETVELLAETAVAGMA